MNSLKILSEPLTLLLLKAHKDVFNSIAGEHISKKKGIAYDFVELREYTVGDDIKHIDWIISSKLGTPYVKIFEEQKELNLVIVPLLCASVSFGVKIFKQEIIAEISALISFSCVKQNNHFTSYISNDDTLLHTKQSKSIMHVRELVEGIYHYKTFSKKLNYELLSSRLYTQLKQKTMIFLIGDFFNTHEFNIEALSSKHEVFVIIVRDKFEENPLPLGKVHIIDPITKQKEYVNINKKEALKYAQTLEKKDATFIQRLKKVGIRFVKIYTDENPAIAIIPLMRSLV